MIPRSLYEDLKGLLSLHFNQPVKTLQLQPVGGGSINQTFRLTLSPTHTFFCKINKAAAYPHLFLKEKAGLQLLAQTLPVPQVVLYAIAGDYQVLLLEWIESGTPTPAFWKRFGEQLATLHQTTHPCFGLHEYNYMGSMPQQNTWQEDWINFFVQQRLQPLAKQCTDKALLTAHDLRTFEQLYHRLPLFFPEKEKPALVHGDLWSGNFMCNAASQPVLIDPAVYYGHRAVDLGMTTLFGGFDKTFYEAYHYHYPLPPHYQAQWDACNLYPLLIHLLLFGKSYLGRIRQTLQALAVE